MFYECCSLKKKQEGLEKHMGLNKIKQNKVINHLIFLFNKLLHLSSIQLCIHTK